MDMCFKEFFIKCDFHIKTKESKFKQAWELARWTSYIGLQPHIKKNSIKQPQDLIKFEWEKEKKKKKVKTKFQKMTSKERHEWIKNNW